MTAGVHLLVDLENVQPSPEEVEAWLGDAGQAWVFYGPHQLKRKAAFERDSPRSTLIPISRAGANSLDFHLVFYLGYLAAKHPNCKFVVLAKDTGYDPPLVHARTLAFSVRRMTALPALASSSSAPSKTPKLVPAKASKPADAPKKLSVPSAKPAKAGETAAAKKSAPLSEQLPARKKTKEKLPIAMYRDLLKELETHRPKSMSALERHIQTKFGPSPVPHKVQLLIDHLLTSDVIHVANSKLGYGLRRPELDPGGAWGSSMGSTLFRIARRALAVRSSAR